MVNLFQEAKSAWIPYTCQIFKESFATIDVPSKRLLITHKASFQIPIKRGSTLTIHIFEYLLLQSFHKTPSGSLKRIMYLPSNFNKSNSQSLIFMYKYLFFHIPF